MNSTTITNNNHNHNQTQTLDLLKWAWGPIDFHSLVVLSLIVQFILFFGAPLRRFTTSGVVHFLVWSSYLLADWVSYYSVGLLVNKHTGPDESRQHIIWGSILIAHMAGPHTISVLDMEDHKQWSRTALKFGTIAFSLAKVSIHAFTHNTKLLQCMKARYLYGQATALYIVAVIKSLEKITTLVLSRKTVIQDKILRKTRASPSNSQIVQGAVLVEVDINSMPINTRRGGKLSQLGALRDAYHLFRVSQGCYMDFKFKFTNEAANSIKEYFLERSAEDAFQVIETELNLVYDEFYTKASMYRLLGVRLVRYFTLVLEIVAFGFLASSGVIHVAKKHALITYSLVLGALFMDTVATLGVIFSIRTIVPADDDRFSNCRCSK